MVEGRTEKAKEGKGSDPLQKYSKFSRAYDVVKYSSMILRAGSPWDSPKVNQLRQAEGTGIAFIS